MTCYTPGFQWILRKRHLIRVILLRYPSRFDAVSKHFDNNFIQGIACDISFCCIFTQELNTSYKNLFSIMWLKQETLIMAKIHSLSEYTIFNIFLSESSAFSLSCLSQLFKTELYPFQNGYWKKMLQNMSHAIPWMKLLSKCFETESNLAG